MSSRSTFRLETRSRARDDIKRIVQAVDKVRRWWVNVEFTVFVTFFAREKKWVDLGLSNSLKVFKWVPSRSIIIL